jgi:hypothetical protein
MIGGVFLDEDDGGECPTAGYFAAIMALKETRVDPRDMSDPLNFSHPPTPEYEGFYSRGVVAAKMQRLHTDIPLPEYLMNHFPNERILIKIF